MVKWKHSFYHEKGTVAVLSIGICDDNQENRLSLRWLLENILESRKIEHIIYEFSSGETLLQWMERHQNEIDLLLLDIEMGKLNGMETAKLLRTNFESLQIVFVTGFSDYVFDGYGVDALGYLLKPAKREQLEAVLDRALARRCKDAKRIYSCHNGDIWYRIPHSEILYFESDRRKITCVTAKRNYSFYGKLDAVEQELTEADFIRIHQRYLVRAAAIRQVCGNEVQIEAHTLPISRSYHQQALLALTRSALED